MPEIFIIATRNCTHAPNLQRELADLGHLASPAPGCQKQYLVPAMTYRLGEHLKRNLGIAAGLTDASDDVVIKSLLEWEL